MEKRFSLNLSYIWLLISLFTLILPIFLPSSAHPQNFVQNVIGTATVTMFILSFPSSLFGLPVLFFAGAVSGVDPNSIGGMYLNLFLLFMLGLVQWFWIVPRLARSEPRFQMLNLIGGKSVKQLSEAKMMNDVPFHAGEGKTPLEKVFEENDSE